MLSHKTWVKLSEHVRVQCISDYYQDAIILIDINGRLLVNTNDALDRGWGTFVRQIIGKYNQTFLLSLLGYGDADMINYYREDGSFIEPKAAMRFPVGRLVKHSAESYGVKYYVPFSTMHKYQRGDSIWAQQYTTPIDAFTDGFRPIRFASFPRSSTGIAQPIVITGLIPSTRLNGFINRKISATIGGPTHGRRQAKASQLFSTYRTLKEVARHDHLSRRWQRI